MPTSGIYTLFPTVLNAPRRDYNPISQLTLSELRPEGRDHSTQRHLQRPLSMVPAIYSRQID
jgi:hypothetical protein